MGLKLNRSSTTGIPGYSFILSATRPHTFALCSTTQVNSLPEKYCRMHWTAAKCLSSSTRLPASKIRALTSATFACAQQLPDLSRRMVQLECGWCVLQVGAFANMSTYDTVQNTFQHFPRRNVRLRRRCPRYYVCAGVRVSERAWPTRARQLSVQAGHKLADGYRHLPGNNFGGSEVVVHDRIRKNERMAGAVMDREEVGFGIGILVFRTMTDISVKLYDVGILVCTYTYLLLG